MTEQPDDRETPRLQDTTERSALPLPLPGSDEPAPAGDDAAPEDAAPEDKAAAVPAPESSPDPEPEPSPAEPAPAAAEPVSSPNGAEPSFPPPFDPYAESEPPGPRPEVLIGAAFAGGLVLALMIRRLGR